MSSSDISTSMIYRIEKKRTRVPRRFDVETTSGRIIRETIAMAFGGRDGSRTRSGKGRLVRDTWKTAQTSVTHHFSYFYF